MRARDLRLTLPLLSAPVVVALVAWWISRRNAIEDPVRRSPGAAVFNVQREAPLTQPDLPGASRSPEPTLARSTPSVRAHGSADKPVDTETWILHVVDRQSRRPLVDVDVVSNSDGIDQQVPHDTEIYLVKRARSPLQLPRALSGLEWLHVRAQGFAWRFVKCVLVDGAATVELTPGGDAVVEVRGLDRSRKSALRLRRAETPNAAPVADVPLIQDGDVTVESLECGRY